MLNKLSRYYNCGWAHNLVINYSLRLGLSAIEYGLRLTFKMLIYPHSVARELRSCRNTRYLTILLIFHRRTYISLNTQRLFIYFYFHKWIFAQLTLVTKVSTKMYLVFSRRIFISRQCYYIVL